MAANGFLEQKPTSPTGFGLVLLLHGAAITGVLLIKGPTWIVEQEPPTITYNVPRERIPEPPPPPPEPQPRPDTPQVQQRVPMEAPVREVPVPVPGPTSQPGPRPVEWTSTVGTAAIGSATTNVPTFPPPMPKAEPPRSPLRIAAQFDPRFARAMQPPYPAVEQRSEREGSVRVRVTIGTDGRVQAVQRLNATSDAFWRATREQALSRWRFRPATEDGQPVESSKELTVHFRLDN